MPAGLNCKVRVIRYVDYDDDVGGASPSGTVLYDTLDARIAEDKVDSAFFQQGIETTKTYTLMMWRGDTQVKEQDVVYVYSPINSFYYNKYIKLVSVMQDSRHPSNDQNYITCKGVRSQRAHGEQFQ